MSDSASVESLYRSASQAAWLGLGVNLALGVAKLGGGIFGHSFALVSDAVNSLGDSLVAIVVLAALWYAQQPPDEEHPYGHTRAEAVAASNVALLVFLSALWMAWEAVHRLNTPHELPPLWTLGIAGANVLIKEVLFRYKRRVALRTGSIVILAVAWDHRSDAFCSFAVLVGLGIVRFAGQQYIWADEAASFVVVAAILWSSGKLFRESTSQLLDPQADGAFVQQIRAAAEAVPGVRAVEKLWVRKSGLEHLVDLHLQVDAALSVDEGHRIGHHVKDRLIHGFATVRDVLVHLEPFRPNSGTT